MATLPLLNSPSSPSAPTPLPTHASTKQCTTDGNGVLDCPGYFGHIELAKPMFHVHFLKTVVKALRCVSYHNSKLMVLPVRAWLGLAGWLRSGKGVGLAGKRPGQGCRGRAILQTTAAASSWLPTPAAGRP